MKKILAIILDGFGMREDAYGNAVKNAGMNNFINIWNEYPHCLLKASGPSANLPEGQPGSSALGHKLIGAGRLTSNRLADVNEIFQKERLKYNGKFNEMIEYLKSNSAKNLHLNFLISDGGVSSHIKHLQSFLELLKNYELKNNIYLHLVADGKDSDRYSVYKYIKSINHLITDNIFIASVCGRYYAMDYTKDYARTKMYYDLLYTGKGIEAGNLGQTIDRCYEKNITDEYLPPLKTRNFTNLQPSDAFLFLSFSKENQLQLLNAMLNKDFIEFDTYSTNIKIYSLYEIDKNLSRNYFFESKAVNHTLCEYLSELGLNQAHIYESVKTYPMSYFINGEKYNNINNCDVFCVDSPVVDSFDMKPEMSSLAISKTAIECMEKDYDFILVNFANPDEVGHTGNYGATINGLQAVDICLGKLLETAEENFYKVIIVSSHAKTDTIINRDNEIITRNTTSPVPFIILDKKVKLNNGDLYSFAPTLLSYMDIAVPKEMKDTEILL